jgi:hypothetical protein
LKWGKVTGASGYVLYKYNTKTGKSVAVKKVSGESTTSYVATTLESGYSYLVRAYKTFNGKTYYGDLSSTPTKASLTVYGIVNDTKVRVRSGAGTSYKIITELQRADV